MTHAIMLHATNRLIIHAWRILLLCSTTLALQSFMCKYRLNDWIHASIYSHDWWNWYAIIYCDSLAQEMIINAWFIDQVKHKYPFGTAWATVVRVIPCQINNSNYQPAECFFSTIIGSSENINLQIKSRSIIIEGIGHWAVINLHMNHCINIHSYI